MLIRYKIDVLGQFAYVHGNILSKDCRVIRMLLYFTWIDLALINYKTKAAKHT